MKLTSNRPMQITVRLFVAVFVLGCFGIARSTGTADDSASPTALSKSSPENAYDLRAIQDQATAVAQKVLPATVALQVGGAQASGVIVTADGYVMTAAHVIGRPGRDVKIIFPDGSAVRGKTLGLNPRVDGGLVQITDEGSWPFAPIASSEETPKPGDWCLATGHPGGFQPGRNPPVRVGRVIAAEDVVIRTDCTISMGDSGGPLFDMKGQVIGIHSRIADDASMNLHVPAATYRDAWEVLKAGEIARQPARFLARFDTNGDGKIIRSEIPEGLLLQVFDRMADKLELDPGKSYPVDELEKSLGLDAPRGFDARALPFPTRFSRPGDSLPRERFAQGRAVRAAFGDTVAATRVSTVRVKCNGDEVALGTIVGADGWIVTKASGLTDIEKTVCVLADGRELPARLVSSDSGCDLALVRVDATELKAVQLHASDVRPGIWLASPGQATEPLAIGVVSVAERPIARSPSVLGILIDDREEGPAVKQVMPGSGAAAAGIKEGDLVTHIAAEAVHTMAQLQAAVRKHRVGDLVKAAIKRDDEELEFSVRLGMPEDSFIDPRGTSPGNRDGSPGPTAMSWRGAVSHRRDDFPAAIQHDSVLRPNDCGGPVVDAAGNVIGINIARADRTASYALPSATVLALLDKLKSESPGANATPKPEK
jgi:serine protease Do